MFHITSDSKKKLIKAAEEARNAAYEVVLVLRETLDLEAFADQLVAARHLKSASFGEHVLGPKLVALMILHAKYKEGMKDSECLDGLFLMEVNHHKGEIYRRIRQQWLQMSAEHLIKSTAEGAFDDLLPYELVMACKTSDMLQKQLDNCLKETPVNEG